MADIIQLLPDSIANQIAAGEVVQRPASVVKELLENAIDAGSSTIKLIVKEAGKNLIQVIDDGCGMSETDARMCFERHATSKIRASKDLFAIRTMGFRGEAMASIAAIAHVELRTRQQPNDLGVRIVIEGSEVKKQEACQCASGTSISVKNLFYNVPARRNFLKSNSVEMRHILDEFQRVAIAHPDIFFSLHHNNTEIYHLPAGNRRQRIVGIFGPSTNKKLVPVSEETDALKLEGFVGKPEFAKKTRGEQLFFVNKRFIKSAYLNHAIMGAYEELLTKGTYPLYVIFIEIDPARIDINVHPTKQEIKFDDERLVYNYLKVAVRHALGQHSITPMLDFDQEGSFNIQTQPQQRPSIPKEQSSVASPKNYTERSSSFSKPSSLESSNLKNWEKLYDGLEAPNIEEDKKNSSSTEEHVIIESEWTDQSPLDDAVGSFSKRQKKPYHIHASYVVSQIKSGFMLIDQQSAHERILYEQYLTALSDKKASTQRQLFPTTIKLSPADASILSSIRDQINLLGFDIEEFGNSSFVINGVPADLDGNQGEQQIIETLIQQYKENRDLQLDTNETIAHSMARSAAIKRGQTLSPIEMQELIDKLFACQVPYKSPSGKNCFITIELDELRKRFGA